MSKTIRIGTRKSELAIWQATVVQNQLQKLNCKSVIVPIDSKGDLVLNKPIYKLGITGVFTKSLDIALLNNEIDIAVHSLKDVPTDLPEGVIQVAVLKRGNPTDVVVYNRNEEFLSQKEAIIATGSLRRKAQWLNRYPTHTVVGLRGNVNTRLKKIKENSHWNAAIFATAGLGRLQLLPQNSQKLDWMIPAPAQGAISVAILGKNSETKALCSELNHQETELCTTIERQFLKILEGGCSAPIGALATIKNEEVVFKGVLLSPDGSKKIEVNRTEKLGKHQDMAQHCAKYIIERGGKRLLTLSQLKNNKIDVYATKTLTNSQKQLFNKQLKIEASDFIKIHPNRIPKSILKTKIDNVIITSKNAVESLITNFSAEELQFKRIYCVGRRTKKLIEQRISKVSHSENNAKKLAEYLVEYMDGTEVTYFCSNLRLEEMPTILTKNLIKVNEVEAYKTVHTPAKVTDKLDGVLFFSPSAVKSFVSINKPTGIAFCIGGTTATEAKKHFKNIRISTIPTVESVIDLVNLWVAENS